MTDISRTYVYPLTLARQRSQSTVVVGDDSERRRPARPDLERELSDILQLEAEEAGELLLVCHAEPERGHGERASLSISGRVQARRLASRLSALWVEAVYSSPEPRAAETAGIIAAALERPVTLVRELSEVGYDAMLAEKDESGCVRLQDRFLANPRWDALPGFEASRSFRLRTVPAIEAVVERHPGRRIVLVTHASVINAYLSLLLDIPRDLFFQPDFTSISCLRFEQGIYALRSLNDTAHLTSICVQWPEGR